MKYIFVFIGLFVFFLPIQAQETANADKANAVKVEGIENTEDKPEQETDAEKTEALPDASKVTLPNDEPELKSEPGQPNFDVFRPSEDISEDLAVPFPADI